MSMPISTCQIYRAAKGDDKAYQSLLKKVRTNLEFGSHSQFPCSCESPCEPCTDTEMENLNARLSEDMAGIKPDAVPPGEQGEPGFSYKKMTECERRICERGCIGECQK